MRSIVRITVQNLFAKRNLQIEFDPLSEVVFLHGPNGLGKTTILEIVDDILNANGWRSYVSNRAGADGVIAGNYVAKANPDGHTIFFSGTGLLDANIVFKTSGIEYNENSFVPVVPVAHISYVFLSKNNFTYNQFKSYVKSNPDKNLIYFEVVSLNKISKSFLKLL